LYDTDEEDPTRVYVCDVNPNMLEVGQKQAKGRSDFYVIFPKLVVHLPLVGLYYAREVLVEVQTLKVSALLNKSRFIFIYSLYILY